MLTNDSDKMVKRFWFSSNVLGLMIFFFVDGFLEFTIKFFFFFFSSKNVLIGESPFSCNEKEATAIVHSVSVISTFIQMNTQIYFCSECNTRAFFL